MHIKNFIQLNDWDIKSFFAVILGIQAACLAAIVIGAAGFELPIIRQLIGLIYLTFVPGYLVLRVLKMHKLGNIETPLYAIGLSVTITMVAGLFTNVFYRAFGISRPLTIGLLSATMTAIVFLLSAACYIRDRDFDDYDAIEVTELTSAPALFLFLLPFLSIFGTHVLTIYGNNILALSLLVVVAAIIVLIGFDKFIPRALYPLAIFSIAISLLYHTALVSMYIGGYDIQFEYYFSNLVLTNGYWDPTFPSQTNSVLSVTILAPLYARIANLDLTWVYKAVYPFLFAFVPLGAFVIFKKQMQDKIAVLSVLFLMSFYMFFNNMPGTAKQEVAELFLILLLVTMLAANISSAAKTAISLVFAFSLVVSHYALSYVAVFFFAAIFVLYRLSGTSLAKRMLSHGSHFESDRFSNNQSTNTSYPSSIAVSLNFVILLFIVTFAWYLYVSGSSAVVALTGTWARIANSIFTDFLSPATSQPIALSQAVLASPLHDLARYLQYIALLFITIGVFSYFVLNRGAIKCYKEYAYLCIAGFLLLVLSVIIPFFASALNADRTYQIALLFLAPFFVIGWIESAKALRAPLYARKRRAPVKEVAGSLQVVSIFIAIFLLFNAGLIYEVLNDHPTSAWLNRSVDYPNYNSMEVQGANWLASILNEPAGTGPSPFGRYPYVYADNYRFQVLTSVGLPYAYLQRVGGVAPAGQYVYLGTYNIVHGQIWLAPIYVDSGNATNGLGKIFDDGGSEIYY
jgi:uncharacterized membrane protein